ncbi:MAG TPA: PIN domain-containing protein [Gemmataceae bacterium]|nr:PIN domain-containing protein [Gemmataceae bacterium]
MNAVDTNILLYSIDIREPTKQAKAAALLQNLTAGSGSTVLPWQALAEAVNQLRRWRDAGIVVEAEFNQHVSSWKSMFPVVFPTIAVLDHALDLARRHSLSHWDSMILGACKDAGVTTLYTEDMGAPTTFDDIALINPF